MLCRVLPNKHRSIKLPQLFCWLLLGLDGTNVYMYGSLCHRYLLGHRRHDVHELLYRLLPR